MPGESGLSLGLGLQWSVPQGTLCSDGKDGRCRGGDSARDNIYLSDRTLCTAKAQDRVGLGSHFTEGETESRSNGEFALELCQSQEGIQVS